MRQWLGMRIKISRGIICLTLLFVIGGAVAGDTSPKKIPKKIDYQMLTYEKIRNYLTSGNESYLNQVVELINAGKITSSDTFYIVQRFGSENIDASVVESVSELLLGLQRKIDLKDSSLYLKETSWDGVKVFQSDDLLNLSSMNYPRITLHATDENGFQIVQGGWDAATIETFGSSASRMAAGLPPVGPDGQSIILCRITNNVDAPLYEMSYNDSAFYLNTFQSNMYHKEACLSDAATAGYWINRIGMLK